jgi:hypothetical protein
MKHFYTALDDHIDGAFKTNKSTCPVYEAHDKVILTRHKKSERKKKEKERFMLVNEWERTVYGAR